MVAVLFLLFEMMAPLRALAESSCQITREMRTVRGLSMSEVLPDRRTVAVEMGFYGCHPVARGQIVLARVSGRADPIIKIAQALPGDRFELVADPDGGSFTLKINGQILHTPQGKVYRYTAERARMLRLYEKSLKGVLPADTYFILGTELEDSFDSTRFGPIKRDALLGRVDTGRF